MHTQPDYLAQASYRCRFDWGRDGVIRADARQDIVVIVDVLRFSTAAVVALQRGAAIYPCARVEEAQTLGRRFEQESAGTRLHLPPKGSDSLSPTAYLKAMPGARIPLLSPNGATCCLYGREAPYVFVGALVNAAAVGAAVALTAVKTSRAVTVIACGERWPLTGEDGTLRFALEDYLGAGAILSHLPFDKSPEAFICQQSFHAAHDQLPALLLGCSSGRELVTKERAADVEYAAHLDCCAAVPILRRECLEPFDPGMAE